MAFLSASVRVGAWRIVDSLASFWMSSPSLETAAAVGSRVEVLTAAVY